MKTKVELSLSRYSRKDRDLIEAALEYARVQHEGTFRKSGDPYITHPVAVAEYVTNLGLDAQTVAAALLHDVLEDTPTTKDDIEQKFGPVVAELVDGVTKLGQVDYDASEAVGSHRQAVSVENVRKLLLAMSRDLRVVMIKLADRHHNLQTLGALPADDRRRIASESLDIFAPLADRLGMGQLKAEIEDLAFEYADPAAYRLTDKLVASSKQEALDYLEQLTVVISKLLKKNSVQFSTIDARQKHLYSIYRKLTKVDGDITKIYDLIALRIVVPDIASCYQALGVLHQNYKPLIYRIKDYIAVPKPNGYRSLHTTVFAVDGRIVEIQIRTQDMHQEAEYGLAAHAIYNQHKESKGYKRGQSAEVADSKLSWVGELASVTAGGSSAELLHDLQIDLFRNRIFVFSPKGDLYDLPEGATAVDFAFAVHSEVGLRAQGARVNGRITPLDKPLDNRDVVEIITRKSAAPNRAWLNFVKTAHARNRIRHWFRHASRETNIAHGRQLLEPKLKAWGYRRLEDVEKAVVAKVADSLNVKDADSLLALIGEGAITSENALKRLVPQTPSAAAKKPTKATVTGKVIVTGAPDLSSTLASCCNPSPPGSIVGYITRGSGVTVHKSGCKNIPPEPDRLIACEWEQIGAMQTALKVRLKVVAHNRIGLVRDVSSVLAGQGINIVEITSYRSSESIAHREIIDVTIEVPDLMALSYVITRLEQVTDVVDVSKEK